MKWILLTIISLVSWTCQGEYLALSTLNLKQQHNYIGENITLEQLAYEADINLQALRIERTGWMARGPKAVVTTSSDSLYIDGHVNLYQSSLHQGFWFEFEWLDSQFSTQVHQSFIYLTNNGSANAITSGDTIESARTMGTGHVYWYESLKDEGPINTAGLFYSLETLPAASRISTTNAEVFDGRFSGFGFTLGRIKDDRGLNFQWRLTLAQLDSNFSDEATQHRSLSALESTVFKLGLELNWHYRYYLTPYWYLVPSTQLSYSTLMQRQLAPEYIDHGPLSYLQYSVGVSLRKYF